MTLGLTKDGAQLLLRIVEFAVLKGYPMGRFERELLGRLRRSVGHA